MTLQKLVTLIFIHHFSIFSKSLVHYRLPASSWGDCPTPSVLLVIQLPQTQHALALGIQRPRFGPTGTICCISFPIPLPHCLSSLWCYLNCIQTAISLHIFSNATMLVTGYPTANVRNVQMSGSTYLLTCDQKRCPNKKPWYSLGSGGHEENWLVWSDHWGLW